MNDKQKKFVDEFYRLGDWHYKEVRKKILELLDNCQLTKKDLEELLDEKNISQFTNDKYLYDEIIDNVYENEDSGYCINELNDDDVVKKR